MDKQENSKKKKTEKTLRLLALSPSSYALLAKSCNAHLLFSNAEKQVPKHYQTH